MVLTTTSQSAAWTWGEKRSTSNELGRWAGIDTSPFAHQLLKESKMSKWKFGEMSRLEDTDAWSGDWPLMANELDIPVLRDQRDATADIAEKLAEMLELTTNGKGPQRFAEAKLLLDRFRVAEEAKTLLQHRLIACNTHEAMHRIAKSVDDLRAEVRALK